MAVDIQEVKIGTAQPDSDIRRHTLQLLPFGGRAVPEGLPIVETVNASAFTLWTVARQGPPAPDNPIDLALRPMLLTQEEAEEMREFIAHGAAYPKIPTRRVPEGDRSMLYERRR